MKIGYSFPYFVWQQGSNYTKAMEAIASVSFDLALMPHNMKFEPCLADMCVPSLQMKQK